MSWLSKLLGGDRPHKPRSEQHAAGWPDEAGNPEWRRNPQIVGSTTAGRMPYDAGRTYGEPEPTEEPRPEPVPMTEVRKSKMVVQPDTGKRARKPANRSRRQKKRK